MIWLIEGDKAPGLDGFPIMFYNTYCDMIKEDLMRVFKDFYEREFLDKGNNATFISFF